MPRESIEMTPAELLDLLRETRWVVLGTLGDEGEPTATLVDCSLEAERLCFAVAAGGAAHRNIQRDPRVCCATDEYPTYYEIRGATLHGEALEAESATLAGPERAVFSIPLDDVVSFDFSKIERRL